MRDSGLTDFGYDAVNRMNKLGMLIDVSHSSDLTASDTIELSRDPILASHVGTRTLTPTSRMFPDDLLQSLAERGRPRHRVSTKCDGHREKSGS